MRHMHVRSLSLCVYGYVLLGIIVECEWRNMIIIFFGECAILSSVFNILSYIRIRCWMKKLVLA